MKLHAFEDFSTWKFKNKINPTIFEYKYSIIIIFLLRIDVLMIIVGDEIVVL